MDLTTAFASINWLSVIIAAITSFIIGGIWYGPLFGKAWMKEFGVSEDDINNRSLSKTFGLALLLAFVAALNLELFIGAQSNFVYGLMAGFFAGIGWVATMLGILYLFEMKSLRAFLINAGYCVTALTAMGAVLGVM